jgi:hypothetical protein
MDSNTYIERRPLLGIIVTALEAPNTCLSGQSDILSYLALSTEYSIEKGTLTTIIRKQQGKKIIRQEEEIPLPEKGGNIVSIFRNDIQLLISVRNKPSDWCNGKRDIPNTFYANYSKDRIESIHQYLIATKANIVDIEEINRLIFSAMLSGFTISDEEKSLITKYANDTETPYFFLAYAWFQAVVTYSKFKTYAESGFLENGKPKLTSITRNRQEPAKDNDTGSNTLDKSKIKSLADHHLEEAINLVKSLIPENNSLFERILIIFGHYFDFKKLLESNNEFAHLQTEEKKKIEEKLIEFIDEIPERYISFYNEFGFGMNSHIDLSPVSKARMEYKDKATSDLEESFKILSPIIKKTEPSPIFANFLLIENEYNSINTAFQEKNMQDNYDQVIEAIEKRNQIGKELISLIDKIPREIIEATLINDPKNIKQNASTVEFVSQDTCFSFPDLIKGAKKLYISARTAVNIIVAYDDKLEDLIKSGCDMRFLLLNGKTKDIEYADFQDNKEKSLEILRRFEKLGCKNLQINSVDILYFSVIYVEKEEEELVSVQMYFKESRTSRNRPLFVLNKQHEWFEAFKTEFDMLWKKSNPMDLKE